MVNGQMTKASNKRVHPPPPHGLGILKLSPCKAIEYIMGGVFPTILGEGKAPPLRKGFTKSISSVVARVEGSRILRVRAWRNFVPG